MINIYVLEIFKYVLGILTYVLEIIKYVRIIIIFVMVIIPFVMLIITEVMVYHRNCDDIWGVAPPKQQKRKYKNSWSRGGKCSAFPVQWFPWNFLTDMILITRLWLKGFFKWTNLSYGSGSPNWRCYHPPLGFPILYEVEEENSLFQGLFSA